MEDNKNDAIQVATDGADTVETTSSAESLAAVAAERDRLARERADFYDQLLRLRAEFENFRKRTQRERSDLVEYAAMEAVRDLVPVLDDFERALRAESADKEYASGIQMIYGKLFETLKKLGLEPLEAEGLPFDPNVHHAVEMKKTNDVEDNTVVEQIQRGYNFKGRLLRPALVKVAVNH
jgi:molecular chaperone GrpE